MMKTLSPQRARAVRRAVDVAMAQYRDTAPHAARSARPQTSTPDTTDRLTDPRELRASATPRAGESRSVATSRSRNDIREPTPEAIAAKAAADPEMAALLRSLMHAIDPANVWDRVETLRVPLDVSGAFPEFHAPGAMRNAGAYAEIWLREERVVFHEVPAPGQTATVVGDDVIVGGRALKIRGNMPERLRRKGSDPGFVLDVVRGMAGPLGAPVEIAHAAVETAATLMNFMSGGLFGEARRAVGIKEPKSRKLSKAEVAYFFAYSLRFYLRMVPLLAHPETAVKRIARSDRIYDDVPRKLGIADPRDYIGLRVEWPKSLRTHSRDMELFFDPETHLLAFFRFDVDTLNDGFRAWYRTTKWHQDPDSGLLGVLRRRAIVSAGRIEIPDQPWTVDAHMGPMTAMLRPARASA